MLKLLFALSFLFFSVTGFTQNTDSTHYQDFLVGIKAGINVCKLPNDSVELSFGTKPLVGVYGKYWMADNFYLNASLQYSIKGSKSVTPYLKIENHYLDMETLLQYKVAKPLYLQAGFIYSSLIASKNVLINGNSKYGVEKESISGYSSEISIPVGFELELLNKINMEFNYFIPVAENHSQNFQLSVNILLNGNTGKESPRRLKQQVLKQQITELKNGTLLIRLKTSDNKINALKNAGRLREAEIAEQEQISENQEIIAAFKNYFTFCKLAFFYSDSSDQVLAGNFNSVFLNDSSRLDTSIQIDTAHSVFFAQFGPGEQYTTYSYSYAGNKTMEYQSLKKVNPYYFSELSKPYDKTVKKMNSKTFKYYKRKMRN